MTRTYRIDGPKTDYLFWVEGVGSDDCVFYEVDFGDSTKFMYSGPEDAHKEVLVDTIQRLVNRGTFPEEILDLPIHPF